MAESEKLIYHYTSLRVLALIVEKRKLKFSKLTMLDDPFEKYVKDLDSHGAGLIRSDRGAYCFVSSWAQYMNESIAMWDMYGDRKRGVRIGLPRDMWDERFDIHREENSLHKAQELSSNIERNLVIPELVDVVYCHSKTDVPTLLDENLNLDISALGKYKMRDWEFQNEIRFRLYAYETLAASDTRPVKCFFTAESFNTYPHARNANPLSTNSLFFGLRDDILSHINIVVGPDMSEGDRLLLNSLLANYSIERSRVMESRFVDDAFLNNLSEKAKYRKL